MTAKPTSPPQIQSMQNNPQNAMWRCVPFSDAPTDAMFVVMTFGCPIPRISDLNPADQPSAILLEALSRASLVFVVDEANISDAQAWHVTLDNALQPHATQVRLQTDWHCAQRLVDAMGEAIRQSDLDGWMYLGLVDSLSGVRKAGFRSSNFRVGQSVIASSGAGGWASAADAAMNQVMPEGQTTHQRSRQVCAIFRTHAKPDRAQWNALRAPLVRDLEAEGFIFMANAIDASASLPEEMFVLVE